jgi:hypothetical protein
MRIRSFVLHAKPRPVALLDGVDPDYPPDALPLDLAAVRERGVWMGKDSGTPDTRASGDLNNSNPARLGG